MKIKLLKEYKENKKDDIISITNDKAKELIENKIAKEVENKDFLVKPENKEATKAFGSSPNDTEVKSSIRGGRFLC